MTNLEEYHLSLIAELEKNLDGETITILLKRFSLPQRIAGIENDAFGASRYDSIANSTLVISGSHIATVNSLESYDRVEEGTAMEDESVASRRLGHPRNREWLRKG